VTTPIRTRIAPSPTGFLHLGTARTALYSWAFARHHGGEFVLRIEDTDVARSTQDSVDQIIAAMGWLGLSYDEGPVYQMQRLERYQAVVEGMLADGSAYLCYCTPDDLEKMKAGQEARGEKRRYDGTWRPLPGKTLPPVPAGVKPVVRFANPADGDVRWDDLVKGPITIGNKEIDDLIIVRDDGVPTRALCSTPGRNDSALRPGDRAAVASSIAETETNIDQVSLEERDVNSSSLKFQVQVRDRKHLARVIRTVRRMPDVQRVSRTLA